MPKKTARDAYDAYDNNNDDTDDAPKKKSSYTIKLDTAQMQTLHDICKARHWHPFEVAYTRYAYKADHLKLNLIAYTSGKLVIAGKGTEDFVRDVLEPEVTKTAKLGYDEELHPDWFEAHAGLDESGKGDFFGPVVAATVIAGKTAIQTWRKAGVQDSKKITGNRILALDHLIRQTPGTIARVVHCGMPRYNELMARPRASLNKLLAWQHAKALHQALAEKPVPWGLLDQFSEQPLVQRELTRLAATGAAPPLPPGFDLRMRTKAEEDPVVAAASIVARAEYVRIMNTLSQRFGAPLQKGASALVKEQALAIMQKFGARALGDFAKLHFRTAWEIVKEAGKLDELPLPEPKERDPAGWKTIKN
ncbi:MAG: ribonuclease HIII [Opitutaceae bacterium]|jgi:ribonuclease HIII|nr:ribonuclease HIII [Opitutaceae bacterium]